MNNSFAAAHPELVCEWSEKNLPLMPDKITYGSNKIVWWKANCGHEWQTSVKSRSAGEKCPICSGARVVEGINDLATLKPELARQWSKKNKLKPTQVSLGSHKKVIHIFISSDTEKDVAFIRHRFFEWRKQIARKGDHTHG